MQPPPAASGLSSPGDLVDRIQRLRPALGFPGRTQWTNVRSSIPFLSVDRPFRALDFQKKLRLIQVIYQEAEPGSHLVS
jgi:hypothetical protein